MDKIYYSYDDISKLIKTNIKKIIDFNPDYIIAIGGGGLIPARIIRNYIDRHIYVVTLSSYDNEEQKTNIDVIQWIDLDLKDILLKTRNAKLVHYSPSKIEPDISMMEVRKELSTIP